MIVHVAQVSLQFHVHVVLVRSSLERFDHFDEWLCSTVEFGHFTEKRIDTTRDRRVAGEQLILDLVDVVLQSGHHRDVLVDHLIEDAVEDRLGSEFDQFGRSFEALSHHRQVGGFGVANGDDEIRTEKDVQFAEFDLFGLVDVPRGPENDEQLFGVPFQFRPLVGCDGVLDGEPVQAELVCHSHDFGDLGSVQADPCHSVPLAHDLEGDIEALGIGSAFSVHIDGVVDDRHLFVHLGSAKFCCAPRLSLATTTRTVPPPPTTTGPCGRVSWSFR